jgi:CubicO group peptidase (beta-lactamase class C family)
MTRSWLIVALAMFAAPCFAADDPAFPGADWQGVAASDAGFSEARIAALRTWLDTQKTTGLLVVSNGHVVLEHGDVARVSKVASVRKSVLAMLYGRYVADGTIDLERTVAGVGLEDLTPFLPLERDATLRHLLMARSGIYLPSGTPSLDSVLPARGSHAPGTFFQYSNWDFDAAGAAFEKLTGRDIYEALETDLARPLGMQDFSRARQEKHDMAPASRFPEYAMYLSARDMARLGLLMLHRGSWNGTQLVPADWIDEITTLVTREEDIQPVIAGRTFANRWGYGMLWWVWDAPNVRGAVTGPYQGAYTAMGAYGQYITVLPVLDLVVAHQVAFEEADERAGREIAAVGPWEYDALLAMIIAAIGE